MNNDLITPPKSWWSRNWPWVVPVGGCLTVIIAGIVLFGSLIFGAMNMMSDSEVVQQALEKVNQDEIALELFGAPIEINGVGGNFSYISKNGVNTAKITCPISGPKAEGQMQIDAIKKGEVWEYTTLKISTEESEVDLADSI
ncbi:hypothetical protein GCM10009117_17060 [Gangjinia marincola]|uniref:Cytochrome oxidase complex assembly protein 1 n=1 Tax=Gangjinia marincola TaxID=578463 RepID=A0ABP3XXF5_9FLAO